MSVWDSPITDGERANVLAVLPQALNEAGISLAFMDFRPEFTARALLCLETLEAEGKVRHVSAHVWRVVSEALSATPPTPEAPDDH